MKLQSARPLLLVLALVLASGALAGCAGKKAAKAPVPLDEEADTVTIADPIEPWNRFWFGFNDKFYMGLGKPFSKVYTRIVPKYGRDRLECAYSNFLAPARFVNALLQLRPDKASRELGRFIINSTFGLGGLYDLAATKPDMGAQTIDFGQTLGVWGFGHGFYLVLPILGPSSFRDGLGLAVDTAMQPTSYVDVPFVLTLAVSGVGRMNRIPETLDVYEELKRSAIEPYSAARDAYAQMRRKLIQDALDTAWVKTPGAGQTGVERAGKPVSN